MMMMMMTSTPRRLGPQDTAGRRWTTVISSHLQPALVTSRRSLRIHELLPMLCRLLCLPHAVCLIQPHACCSRIECQMSSLLRHRLCGRVQYNVDITAGTLLALCTGQMIIAIIIEIFMTERIIIRYRTRRRLHIGRLNVINIPLGNLQEIGLAETKRWAMVS